VERIVMYRETRGRDAQLWVTVPCAAKGSLRNTFKMRRKLLVMIAHK
jgi:hypothetical protein